MADDVHHPFFACMFCVLASTAAFSHSSWQTTRLETTSVMPSRPLIFLALCSSAALSTGRSNDDGNAAVKLEETVGRSPPPPCVVWMARASPAHHVL